jgi:chitinase
LTTLSKTFAPYADILLWPTLDISQVAEKTGVLHYTLAFIFAGANNQPAWGGVIGMEQNFYADQLARLRQRGGDAIVSFGGANGNIVCKQQHLSNFIK